MSTQDNLENYMKNRLESQDFEFSESQWQKVSERLDALDAAAGASASGIGGMSKPMIAKIISGALIIGSISFYAGWSLSESKEPPAAESTLTEASTPSANILDNKESTLKPTGATDLDERTSETTEKLTERASNATAGMGLDKTSLPTELKPTEKSSQVTAPTSSGTPESIGIAQKSTNKKTSETPTVTTAALAKGSDNNEHKKQPTSLNTRPITEPSDRVREVPDSNSAESDDAIRTPVVFNKPLAKIEPITSKDLALLDASNTAELDGPVPYESTGSDTAPVAIKATAKRSHFSFALFVAPDFNSTSGSDLFASLGEAAGAKIHYYAGGRFRTGVGIVLNNKVYTARKGDYTPIKGFWTDGIAPESTDAKCLALDIPLEIGYRVFGGARSAWWLNAGISNYLLLTEKYDYAYASNDPDLVQQWQGKNENYHLASSLNFSVSRMAGLSKNYFLLLEPYFKLPLKGIGHGSVQLMNGGLSVGIVRRRRP